MDLFPSLNVKLSLNGQVCYDCKNDNLSALPNKAIHAPKICRIYASTNIIVPARSMHIGAGVIKERVPVDQLGIIESLYDQGSERFCVGCGRGLDTVRNNRKILMHLTNTKDKVIKITKGTCVGTFSTTADNPSVINSISMPREGTQRKDQLQMARKLSILIVIVNSAEMSDSAKHRLYKVIKTNADVFSVDGELGATDVVEHVIPTGVSAPRAQPARRMPFHKLQEVDKFVQGGLANNIIRSLRTVLRPRPHPIHHGRVPWC